VSANELMDSRVTRLMDDYDLTSLDAVGDELFARSERAMRRAIGAVPDGTYRFALETDGFEQPYQFRIALTVKGDEIIADYAGTSPAQPRAINCVMAYTYAMTAYAVRCALLPGLPNNEGMYRPVKVEAPEGSLLNPRWPAAVVSRSNTGHYVPTLVFGALHQVVPDRVMAGVGSPLWAVTQSGVREDGRTYSNVLFYNGGMGATSAKDGENVLSWPSNISSTPVEVAERNSPLFFHYKRLRRARRGRPLPGRPRAGHPDGERVRGSHRHGLHGGAHELPCAWLCRRPRRRKGRRPHQRPLHQPPAPVHPRARRPGARQHPGRGRLRLAVRARPEARPARPRVGLRPAPAAPPPCGPRSVDRRPDSRGRSGRLTAKRRAAPRGAACKA
jgi:hypothetical protein